MYGRPLPRTTAMIARQVFPGSSMVRITRCVQGTVARREQQPQPRRSRYISRKGADRWVSMPNGAHRSSGRGQICVEPGPTPAPWRSVPSSRWRPSADTRDYTECAALDHLSTGPSVPIGRHVGAWSAPRDASHTSPAFRASTRLRIGRCDCLAKSAGRQSRPSSPVAIRVRGRGLRARLVGGKRTITPGVSASSSPWPS